MNYADPITQPAHRSWREIEVGSIVSAAAGLCLTGLPAALHLITPWLAFGFVAVAGVGLARLCPGAMVAWIATTFLFQGLFVSIASPAFATASDLEQLKLYNTVFAASAWAS